MLLDLLKSGFGKASQYTEEEKLRFGGVNLNCCERILYGANQAYGLGLSDQALRVAAPFGGGHGHWHHMRGRKRGADGPFPQILPRNGKANRPKG